MRLLLALLCCAFVCSASPTTITDVLHQPYNSLPAAGVDVTITQLAFFSGTNYYPAWSVTIHPVTDASGNLSVQLEPNPAGQPYSVILTYPNGVKTSEYWNVPASGTPLTIKQVITAVGPTPPLGFVQLNQLAQSGAILNNVIAWNGIAWVASPLGTLGLEVTANKDAASGYAGLTAGSLLKVAEFPAFTGDCTTSSGTVAINCTNAIARTGVDINTSNQVIGTHLSAALPVNQGGTGQLALAAHGTLIGEGTGGLAVASPGTAGNVLTSNGASADPTFQAPSGSASTAFQTYGYNAGQFTTATANATTCAGIIFPALSVGHIFVLMHSADGSNNSDVGIYNSAGTLVAHIGAQHITSFASYAFSGGTQSIPAGKGYYCITSAASTFAVEANTAATSFYSTQNVSGATTSGGALLASITPPADSVASGGGGIVPVVILLP